MWVSWHSPLGRDKFMNQDIRDRTKYLYFKIINATEDRDNRQQADSSPRQSEDRYQYSRLLSLPITKKQR